MKLHQIALAAAFLVAGAANAAGTVDPTLATAIDAANTAGRVISISGASAVQKGFTGIIGNLFAGTPTYFTNKSGAAPAVDSADYIGVFGTLAAGTGTWAGQTAIVLYRVSGGSVYGVDPVARATPITALNLTGASCGSVAGGLGTAAAPHFCTTTTKVPDAGVSDVAPALFKAPINTEGETAASSLTAIELASLKATPIYGLAFGLPVTSNVPATTKFTRSLVAAIMTGNVGTWDEVDGTTGEIVICRRTPGSGTQAVMNLWAGNFPCSAAVNVPADRTASEAWDPVARKFTAADGAEGLIVIENSTSSDVVTCLDKAVAGGTYSTKDRSGNPVTVDFGGGGYKAVGVLSMDSIAKSKVAGNWQFRALDGLGNITQDNTAIAPVVSGGATGKLPTLETYENGDWDLQGWVSFNLPTRTTGAKKGVLDKFVAEAQKPTVLASISALKYVAAAIPKAGLSGAQVLDAAYAGNNQCAPYNRNYNN